MLGSELLVQRGRHNLSLHRGRGRKVGLSGLSSVVSENCWWLFGESEHRGKPGRRKRTIKRGRKNRKKKKGRELSVLVLVLNQINSNSIPLHLPRRMPASRNMVVSAYLLPLWATPSKPSCPSRTRRVSNTAAAALLLLSHSAHHILFPF